LARAEIGCYLSHVQAMRQFLRTDKKYLLLFEDDASPEPDFMRVIEQLLEVPEQWDVVKLSGFHNPYVIHSNHLINGYVYGVPTTRHCNTAAVLYNRKAAQQFIECMLPMSLPFDHALEQPWLYDVKLRVVKPSPVQAGDGAESTIVGTKTQKFKWYRRLGTYGFRIKNELQRLVWSVWQ
jgi:glycosyl transferase family 25